MHPRLTLSIVAPWAVVALAAGCATQRPRLEESPVRLTEIHFNPSPAQGRSEFVELANVTARDLDLSGWAVTGAGRVELAPGTVLAPGAALVLAQEGEDFEKTFAGVRPNAVLAGKLRNEGEVVRIEDPAGLVADEVFYDPAIPAVQGAAGSGLSLQRVSSPTGSAGDAWKAAEPTPGRAPIAPAGASR